MKKFSKIITSIDFSDSSIEMAQVGVEKGHSELINKNRVEFELGVIDNGEIKNFEKYFEIHKKIFFGAEKGKIEANEIILGLPESQVFFVVEDVTGKNISDETIKEILQKNIPFKINSVRYAFSVKKTKVDSGEKRFVVILAARIDYLESLENFYSKLNIKIKHFDFSFLSTQRYIYDNINSATYMLVDLGSRYTTFTVFDKQDPVYASRLNVGGISISKNISEKTGCSLGEAETIKKKIDVFSSDKSEISSIITDVLTPVTYEIKTITDYFYEKYKFKIEEIIIAGGGSKIINIDKIFNYKVSNSKYRVININKIKNKNVDVLFYGVLGMIESELSKNWANFQPIKTMNSEKSKKILNINYNFPKFTDKIVEKIKIIFIITLLFLVSFSIFRFFSKQKVEEFSYRDVYMIDFADGPMDDESIVVFNKLNYKIKNPDKIETIVADTKNKARAEVDEGEILLFPLEPKDDSKIVFPLDLEWLYAEKSRVRDVLRKKIQDKYDNLESFTIDSINFGKHQKKNDLFKVEIIVDFTSSNKAVEKNLNDIEKRIVEDATEKEPKKYIEVINIPKNNNLNIRKYPEKGNNVVSKAKLGEKYEFVSSYEGWNKILLKNGDEAWVREEYSKITN